jgi:hypothetical protein
MAKKIQLKLSGFEIRYFLPDPESSELDKIPGHAQIKLNFVQTSTILWSHLDPIPFISGPQLWTPCPLPWVAPFPRRTKLIALIKKLI